MTGERRGKLTGRQVAIGYALCALTVSALTGLVATIVLPFHGMSFAGSWLIDFAIINSAWMAAAPFIGPRIERRLTGE